MELYWNYLSPAMRKLLIFIAMVTFLFGYSNDVSLAQQDFITMDNGLRYLDVEREVGRLQGLE